MHPKTIKAEPWSTLPVKTKGQKRKLLFALLFEVKHDIFKDAGDADDSFSVKIMPGREPVGGGGEIITGASRFIPNLDAL